MDGVELAAGAVVDDSALTGKRRIGADGGEERGGEEGEGGEDEEEYPRAQDEKHGK